MNILRGIALSMRARNGWRHIASAPLNGSEVDLWLEGDGYGVRVCGFRWLDSRQAWIDRNDNTLQREWGDLHRVTHWRPVPGSPT